MSRVIKQSAVALSAEKKLIQNLGHLRPALPEKPEEVKGNAPMRLVQDLAHNLQKESQLLPVGQEPAEFKGQDQPGPEPDLQAYQAQADEIMARAHAEKEKIYDQAYHAGMDQAKAELDRRLESLEQEYAARRQALEAELEHKYRNQAQNELNQLEAKMILWMQHMLIKLVGQAGKNDKVLLHLIRLGMQEIPLQGDLIIRVSEADLDYVLQHKYLLTEELSEKLMIEVLKDKSLKKNQCIIETIMGNIECSLDVQLKGITDELRLIYESIMKNVHFN